MSERPYVLLSCGMSLDGYLNGPTEQRLLLSNDEDFERVDAVRASCDAILVGARTIRRDDPRLLIRSPNLRDQRVTRGQPEQPMKVTVTDRAKLEPCSKFFTLGDAEKVVYCSSSTVDDLRQRVGHVATIVDGGQPVDFPRMVKDLSTRGIGRLMVEGGGLVHTQFLTAGLVDELQLVVAPLFVGDSRARRFVGDGEFPWHAENRAKLADVCQIGDVVLLRYALSDRFDD